MVQAIFNKTNAAMIDTIAQLAINHEIMQGYDDTTVRFYFDITTDAEKAQAEKLMNDAGIPNCRLGSRHVVR